MIEEEKNENKKEPLENIQNNPSGAVQKKFYCESCGAEITEEEYKEHNGMCKECFL